MNYEDKTKKRGNFLFRQELKNLTIEQKPLYAFICNILTGLILIMITIPVARSTRDYKEYVSEYTNCAYITEEEAYNYKLENNLEKYYNCEVNLEVMEDMKGPVYLFYEIFGFYINHKEFVRSKIFSSLRNENDDDSEYLKCEGAQFMYQVKEDGIYKTVNDSPLKNNSLAIPCGLYAKYRFTDEFKIHNKSNENNLIEYSSKGISYKEHQESLFKNRINKNSTQYINVEDGKFD